MADEKLPKWLTKHLGAHIDECVDRLCTGCIDEVAQLGAIHRYAREREAAALERAAKVCDAKADVMQQNFAASMNDEWLEFKTCYETAAKGIRALIHKEPANG